MLSKNSPKADLFKEIAQVQIDMQSAKMEHDEYLKSRRSIILGYTPAIETISEREEVDRLYDPYIKAKKKYDELLSSLNEEDLNRYEEFKKDTLKANDVSWFFIGCFVLAFAAIVLGFIFPLLTTSYIASFTAVLFITFSYLGIKEYKTSGVKKQAFRDKWGVYPLRHIYTEG